MLGFAATVLPILVDAEIVFSLKLLGGGKENRHATTGVYVRVELVFLVQLGMSWDTVFIIGWCQKMTRREYKRNQINKGHQCGS